VGLEEVLAEGLQEIGSVPPTSSVLVVVPTLHAIGEPVGPRELVWMAWHARGQKFNSPQLQPRSAGLSTVDRPRIPALAQLKEAEQLRLQIESGPLLRTSGILRLT
jgi:hypothetical protein